MKASRAAEIPQQGQKPLSWRWRNAVGVGGCSSNRAMHSKTGSSAMVRKRAVLGASPMHPLVVSAVILAAREHGAAHRV